MQLTIKRSYEPRPPGEQYHSPYRVLALIELTDEEKELVDRYDLGGHVLTQTKYRATKLKDLLSGSNDIVGSVDIAIGNEQVLRAACADLVGIFSYCRTFGQEVTFSYP